MKSICKIKLTKNKFAIVDEKDFKYLSRFQWCYSTSKTRRATKRQEAAHTTINGKTVKMHQLLMYVPSNKIVDHINGDQLDNRRSNLRLATRSQNLQNSAKYQRRKTCSSKYKGVSWNKKAQKWEAGLHYKGKRVFLGLFDNEFKAAQAYDLKASELFKAFAKLNFNYNEASRDDFLSNSDDLQIANKLLKLKRSVDDTVGWKEDILFRNDLVFETRCISNPYENFKPASNLSHTQIVINRLNELGISVNLSKFSPKQIVEIALKACSNAQV